MLNKKNKNKNLKLADNEIKGQEFKGVLILVIEIIV